MKISDQMATLFCDVQESLYVKFDNDIMRYYLSEPSSIWLDNGRKIVVTELPPHLKNMGVEISDDVGLRIHVYESELVMIPLYTQGNRYVFIMNGLKFDFEG